MNKLLDRWKKILFFIPDYAHLPLILVLIANCTAYYAPMIARVHPKFDFSVALDSRIPVIPAFAYIYIAAFAFWTLNYIIICRQSRALTRRLCFADMFSKLVCVICFLFIPSTMAQPDSGELHGVGAWLLKLIYLIDEPMNLLPSIHCLVSWLCFRPLLAREAKNVPTAYKAVSFLVAMLICLSTLYTRQHVILDWITGVAVAEMGWLMSRYIPLGDKKPD